MEQEESKRIGRRPYPWAPERMTATLPEGTSWLVEQMVAVMRRWNGTAVQEGVVVAEAVLALAQRIIEHPETTEGERAVIRERADVLNQRLKTFYSEFCPGEPVRP